MKVYFSDPLTFASTITRLPSDVTDFSMFAAQTWEEKGREPGNEVGILGQKQPLVFYVSLILWQLSLILINFATQLL